MNKIYLLILILIIIFLALLLLLTRGKSNIKIPILPPVLFSNPSPSIYPSRELPTTPLSIIQVLPEDEATNVSPTQQVQIVFSRSLKLEEVYISFGPGVEFETTLNSNTITLAPKQPLGDGLTYKLLIKFNKTDQLSKQYQFTIEGTPPKYLPDTQPSGAAQQSEESNLKNHPDIYLANKTPLKESGFDLYKGMLKSSPQEHYSFVVVKKTDSAQNDLTTKLTSLGLNQDQISGLELIFISQDQFNKVIALKDKLPYYNFNVSISYDNSYDKTTIYMDKNNKTAGEQQLNDFLKENGIDSLDWIDNLSIIYH